MARRISGRWKNRSPPRTWYGTPASVSACSYVSDWALTRNSTAISLGGTPSATIRRIRVATAAASATSSSCSLKSGSGPGGRWPTSRSRVPAGRSRAAPMSVLAHDTTWGVER